MDHNLEPISNDQLAELLPGYNFGFGTSLAFDVPNDIITDPTFYNSFYQQPDDPRIASVDAIDCNNDYIAISQDLATLNDPPSLISIHDFFQFDDNATDSALALEFEADVKPTFEGVVTNEEPHGSSRKSQLLIDSVAPVIDDADADSFDLQNLKSSDGSESNYSSTDASLIVHQYGWTLEDNCRLDRLVTGELAKVNCDQHKLNWANITKAFNDQYNQKRSKVQVYSHWRNYTVLKKRPCYSAAEEEAIKALNEIEMNTSLIAKLVNDRNEGQIRTKIAKMQTPTADETAPPVDAEELKRRAKFRERVKNVVLDSGWLMDETTLPQDLVTRMRTLLSIDPHLLKNSHPIGVGRPKKTKTFDATSRNPYRELASLLRPFTYVNNRRKRTTCLPGDGRRYGLNLFAIYRLLGASFCVDTLPKEPDDVLEKGVKEVDLHSFIVMRDMIAKLGRGSIQDRFQYNQVESSPPTVSLLPPMLFSVTGIRSLILYSETLQYSVAGDAEAVAPPNKKVKIEPAQAPSSERCQKLIDEADDRVMQLLESVFFYSWHIIRAREDSKENSDIETDSDEERVWCAKDEDTQEDDHWF